QAAGNQGPIYVKVPYSLIELEQWKSTVGKYKENPDKVAALVQRAIQTQNPDWSDSIVMMDTLLDSTEKQIVNKVMTDSVESGTAIGTLQGTVADNFPTDDPRWDPNVPADMQRLKWYQDLIVYGLKHGVPKALSWAKLYEVKQGPNETPTDFLN
ncbi:hypothetical protein N302_14147, partial [Corvus brachyrhynchos]